MPCGELGGSKKLTPTADWRFRVLDGSLTINLEVKNRRGTAASKPMKKGVYLFGEHPEKPFRPSTDDEINVLAITAHHAGAISPVEENQLARDFLEKSPAGEVLDAVALYVVGQGSRERLGEAYLHPGAHRQNHGRAVTRSCSCNGRGQRQIT
jgi:hypothetical protein